MNNPARLGSLDRSLPHSPDAEKVVLGACLIDNALFSQIVSLKPDDFYVQSNKGIFSSMVRLFDRGQPLDPVLIVEEAKKGGVETTVSRVAELTTGLYRLSSLEEYVKLIKDNGDVRTLIRTCNQIVNEAWSSDSDTEQILDEAESRIYGIRDAVEHTASTKAADEVLRSLEGAKARKEAGSGMIGLATGFYAIDKTLQGAREGQLIITAARPSIGKTAIVCREAYYQSVKLDEPVIIFSLEMSKEEIADRIICAECSIDSRLLKSGHLTDAQWASVYELRNKLEDSGNLFINDDPYMTLRKIRIELRRLNAELRKRNKRIKKFYVDHIGLLMNEDTKKGRSRNDEVGENSRGLKKICKEFSCAAEVLSQLNRQSENRNDHRPMMSELRESGNIEQDADVVMLLYREDVYRRDSSQYTNTAEVIIAKNRNGPTGLVKLHFEPRFARFADITFANERPIQRSDESIL